MNKYRVIWFDDEHASLDIIREKAYLNDIDLIGFSNAKEGIEELTLNLKDYDAAIIDGLFFLNAEQSGTPTSDKAFFDVAIQIEKLASIKKLPWFILSGQTGFTKEKNRYADGLKGNDVFDKLNDGHLERLWSEIKLESNKQVDTQIKHKYARVFKVCTDKYIGNQGANHLLTILKNEHLDNAFDSPEVYFNPLRKIMDDLFIAFNKYGLLPDVFVSPSVALNESSKFLSGQIERGCQLNGAVFPKVVSDNVRNILGVCQPASHRSEIDDFVAQVNTPYLLLSVTYQLLDVLLWFKNFIDNNNNIEANRTLYKKVEAGIESSFTTSIIGQDEKGNYHCGEIIITYKIMNENNYQIGDEIRIIKIANNTNEKTMHLYPKSALQTEKL